MATVTAGLRWPPDTPPLTRIPSTTPIPHLARDVLDITGVIISALSYPQLILKKSPLCPSDSTDCAIEPAPNNTSINVPENII